MKLVSFGLVAALAAGEAAAHATFQQFWVNGVDKGSTCVRLPPSNSPVTNVASNDLRCNVNGATGVSGKCAVKAGDTVTVEMHQQNGDRSCSTEAIGGAHYGPVNVYMSKVSDASTADGSSGWFKVFADSWAKGTGTGDGSTNAWGTKDLNSCCGKMDLKIPSDIAAGDYLLRAEAIALHAASQPNGAQFYMSCFQITVSGGGSNSPDTVKFPGAYSASDPGILFNMYQPISSYANPGPAVISSGLVKTAGSACGAGTSPGTGSGGTSPTTTKPAATTTLRTSTSSAAQPTTSTGGSGGSCAAKYAQCGGSGWTGATCCAAGSTCTASGSYYSQCL